MIVIYAHDTDRISQRKNLLLSKKKQIVDHFNIK